MESQLVEQVCPVVQAAPATELEEGLEAGFGELSFLVAASDKSEYSASERTAAAANTIFMACLMRYIPVAILSWSANQAKFRARRSAFPTL